MLLTKDLENLETEGDAGKLESFASDTELMGGHPELVERAQKFAAEIKAKASQVGIPTASEEKEITDLGGSTTEVAAQVEGKKSEATETAAITEQAIEVKVTDANPETSAATEAPAETSEIVGENFPISLDYVGQRFESDESEGQVDYEINGKIMLRNGPDSGGKEILSFPVKWEAYRNVNWRTENLPIAYKKTDDYESFQTINTKLFFDPATKEIYFIDPSLGKKSIPSAAMVATLEEAYSKLKNDSENSSENAGEKGKESVEDIENKKKLTQLENIKKHPKFNDLLDEAKDYEDKRMKLKNKTDLSISLGEVQRQGDKFVDLLRSIDPADPGEGLTASGIMKIDKLIDDVRGKLSK